MASKRWPRVPAPTSRSIQEACEARVTDSGRIEWRNHLDHALFFSSDYIEMNIITDFVKIYHLTTNYCNKKVST